MQRVHVCLLLRKAHVEQLPNVQTQHLELFKQYPLEQEEHIESEDGQDAQLAEHGRQNSEFEVNKQPVLQDVITVALVQADAPVAQFLQAAVVESKYVPVEQDEHFEMPLLTWHVRQEQLHSKHCPELLQKPGAHVVQLIYEVHAWQLYEQGAHCPPASISLVYPQFAKFCVDIHVSELRVMQQLDVQVDGRQHR